jgi:hypothetical protein
VCARSADALGTPAGSYVGVTGSGLRFVGAATDTALDFGVGGEAHSRLRVTADGALHYFAPIPNTTSTSSSSSSGGSGTSSSSSSSSDDSATTATETDVIETAVITAQRSNVTVWDAPALAPGEAVKVEVLLAGAKRGADMHELSSSSIVLFFWGLI